MVMIQTILNKINFILSRITEKVFPIETKFFYQLQEKNRKGCS